jgi:competence protein ComEC
MPHARPIVPLAAGVVAGAAFARAVDPGLLLPLAALSVCAVVIIRRPHPVLVGLLGLCAGLARQEAAETRTPGPLEEGVEGVVDGPPRIYRSLGDPEAPDDRVYDGSFVVGRVQVRYFRKSIPLLGGERVRIAGATRRPRPPGNPGQFDYAAWLDRQGVDAVLTLRGPEDLRILEGPSRWHRATAWLRSLFDRGTRPEVGSFLSAIVLGRREPIDDGLLSRFQRSGTAHLLAISGQNLLIVLVGIWFLLVLAGVHGRLQTALLLVLLALYVPLTGFQVSVVRSYLMIAVFLGADLLWRRRDPLASLAAAALLITLVDPSQVADAGFQLSFAAVLGLSHIAPALGAAAGPGGPLWDRFRMALAASTAAWLATAPIVLVHFNLFTPGIVLANLAIVPIMSAQFVVGLLHLVFAALGAGALTGFAANFLFDAVDLVSRGVTALPLAYAYGPGPGAVLMTAYAAGLAAWTLWSRRLRSPALRLGLLLPLVAVLGLGGVAKRRTPDVPRLAVLDVGRGSCAVLERPDGRVLMFDCGSLDHDDPGAVIAAPYLWQRGITRIDTLVLSHPDLDHVNGARTIIERFRPSRVLITRAFKNWDGLPIERRGAPEVVDGLEILGPPVWEKFGDPPPANETSIVVRGDGILIPGDAQDRGVEELLTLPDLSARVLVLPHHGKFFQRYADLYRRTSPELVIASAPVGYSSSKVLEASPVPLLLTGREGAIELEVPKDGPLRILAR